MRSGQQREYRNDWTDDILQRAEEGGSMVLVLWLLLGASVSHLSAQEELSYVSKEPAERL